MVEINLGSISNQNGTTAASGLISGLDSETLIEASLSRTQTKIDNVTDSIGVANEKIELIAEFKTKLETFRSSADTLRNPFGFNNQSDNFFEYRTANVSSADGNSYITASAEPGANVGTFNITNVDLAKPQIIRKDGFTSNTESVVGASGEEFSAGSFTLGGVDIELAEGDSLIDIRSAVNATSSSSGVSAEVIEVSSGNFSLQLKAVNSGEDNSIAEFAAGSIQFGGDIESFTETQVAENATFDFDGLTISRSSNVIDDLIDNVTISLQQDSGVTESTLEITKDDTVAQNGIVDFLSSYNDLKTFIAEQTETDENGVLVETAILGDEPVVSDTLRAIDAQIVSLVQGLDDGAVQTLFNIGISFTNSAGDSESPAVNNLFEVDFDTLENAFAADFDNVRKLFEFDFTSDSNNLIVLNTSNNITLTDFKIDVDTTRSAGDEVRVLDAATDEFLFNATYDDDGLIYGADGTALQGLELIYSGDEPEVITVSLSQGTADKVFNVLDGILSDSTGAFNLTIEGLVSEIAELEEDEINLNIDIENERDKLLAEFANLEAVISEYNTVLLFLEAQADANSSN